jgi:hypothetical protein
MYKLSVLRGDSTERLQGGHMFRKVPLTTAAVRLTLLVVSLSRRSHWQQDVEEADTSAICNKTSHTPRSPFKAPASREFTTASDESFIYFMFDFDS